MAGIREAGQLQVAPDRIRSPSWPRREMCGPFKVRQEDAAQGKAPGLGSSYSINNKLNLSYESASRSLQLGLA
jgi:hypothetical protein